MYSVVYGTGGGGIYSYVCVHRPPKQLISKKLTAQNMKYNYEYDYHQIIIKYHTPLNTSISVKVDIDTSHAMCNVSIQQMMGKI